MTGPRKVAAGSPGAALSGDEPSAGVRPRTPGSAGSRAVVGWSDPASQVVLRARARWFQSRRPSRVAVAAANGKPELGQSGGRV